MLIVKLIILWALIASTGPMDPRPVIDTVTGSLTKAHEDAFDKAQTALRDING